MSETTTPTPRTDAAYYEFYVEREEYELMVEHARTLERELAVLKTLSEPLAPVDRLYGENEFPEATRTINGHILGNLEYAEVTLKAHWANGRQGPWKAVGILLAEYTRLREALPLLAPDTRTETP